MTDRSNHRIFRSLAAAAGAVLLMAASVGAQNVVQVESWTKDSAVALPAASDGKIELSLEEATALALSRNLDLVVSRVDARKARFGVLESKGIFDASLQALLQATSDESPNASSVFGSKTQGRVWNLSVSQLLLTGGTVSVGFDNSRRETNAAFTTVNPYYSSSFGLNVTQPLLKGFGPGPTSYGLEVARIGRSTSEQELRRQVRQKILDVENAYWDLVFAREDLAVKKSSLDLANDLLRITKIRVDVGTLAPIEIVGSESGVAQREEEIIRAEAAVANAEDQMKRMLDVPEGEWGVSFEPTDTVSAEVQPLDPTEVDRAIAHALESRPEMIEAQLQVKNTQLTVDLRKNQALPSVDLSASYAYAGLGGDTRCDVFSDPNCDPEHPQIENHGGWSDALRQVRRGSFPNWAVGLNVSVPLPNRAARARRTTARLELEKAQASLESLRQSVFLDVRLAARSVDTAAKAVQAAEKARVLAEKNLDAERKKYENGMTTNFQVLQIEQQLAEARSNELQARISYRRALVGFHNAKGDLLETKGVSIESQSRVEKDCWLACYGTGTD